MKTLILSSLTAVTALMLAGCSAERADDSIASDESAFETDHRYKPAGLRLTDRFLYATVQNGLTGQTELWRRPFASEQWQTVAQGLDPVDGGTVVAAGSVVAFWKHGPLHQRECNPTPLELLSDDAAAPIAVDLGGCIREATIDTKGRRIIVRVMTPAQAPREAVLEYGSLKTVSFDGAVGEDIPSVRPQGSVYKVHVVDGVIYGYAYETFMNGGLARFDPATRSFEHLRVRCKAGDGFAHVCKPDANGVSWRYTSGPVLSSDGPDALFVTGPTRLVRAAGSAYYDETRMYPTVQARGYSATLLWQSFMEGGKAYLARHENNFNLSINTGEYQLARLDLAAFDATVERERLAYIDDVPWVTRIATGSTGRGAVADIVLRNGKFHVLRYADARDAYPTIEEVSADAPSLPRANPGPQGPQPPPPCCGG